MFLLRKREFSRGIIEQMTRPDVSVIIPAYNEQERLGRTLTRVEEYLSKQDYSWEVLVVLDGPTDRTPTVAQSFEDKFKGRLKVTGYKKNKGKGAAVRQGMLEAKGKIRMFTDSDNSTDIHYLEDMLKKFDEGFDLVISSRDKKDAKGAGQDIKQPWVKRQMGNMGNIYIQIVAVWGIWDTQNGFKGFTADAAEDIFSRIRINRWAFDVEALSLARHLNYKIGIIPIIWKNDPKSHVKLSSYFQFLLETTKVRWNLMTGKYKRKIHHG